MARSSRRLLAAFGVALVPAALACTSIVGLDDFQKTQCPGAICSEGGPFDDASVPDATSDARVDAQGADPVRWARWKMPNYPTDAAVNPNPATYTPNGDLVVAGITDLTWQRDQSAPKTYADAKKYCEDLVVGGESNFRLPSRIELVTLLDLEKTPRIDTAAFTGTTGGPYWTSSEVRPFDATSPSYWVVDFADGHVKKSAATNLASVRCVKGTP